jgi:hypothetical protein
VQPLVQLVVAVEMLLVPAWAAAAGVSPPASMARRLGRVLAPVVVVGVAVVVLGAIGGEGLAWGAVEAQAVAIAFAVLVAGLAQAAERLAGPRAAQGLAAVAGWLILGGVVLGGPAAKLADEPMRTAVVQLLAGGNPLIMAERQLGADWLHANLMYVLTPVGEDYSYLLRELAWWKTAMWYLFIGSGLLVFSLKRRGP